MLTSELAHQNIIPTALYRFNKDSPTEGNF